MLGAPYRYGGESQHGFDCSGLVVHAYRNAGIRVPRTSSEQYRQAQRIVLAELQPGDLLFFRVSPPKISHVGIYDSGSSFIHASSSGKRVEYASLEDPYWRAHLVGAGRF
jgi:cell wall-associated NlpC family hydrolase